MKTIILAFAVTAFALSPLQAETAKPSGAPAGCCKKAAASEKSCTHGCCVTSAKDGKNCEKCGGKNEAKADTAQ